MELAYFYCVLKIIQRINMTDFFCQAYMSKVGIMLITYYIFVKFWFPIDSKFT